MNNYIPCGPYTAKGLYRAPFPAGHKDGTLDFNATQQQTSGSGQSWLSGNRTSKPMQMTVQIPTKGNGTSRAAMTAEMERWEAILEKTTRWYVGARYRKVTGLLSFDRSRWGVVTAVLALKNPLWYLSDDDARPRRYPLELDDGMYPLGLLQVLMTGDGYYEVGYLGGVSGSLTTLSLPNSGITLTPLELTYDNANEL